MKPTVGRIVHYVMPEHVSKRAAGQSRAAMIVRVWDGDTHGVNVTVFTDHSNDADSPVEGGHASLTLDGQKALAAEISSGVLWQTSVAYDESGKPGTWHWPPRE